MMEQFSDSSEMISALINLPNSTQIEFNINIQVYFMDKYFLITDYYGSQFGLPCSVHSPNDLYLPYTKPKSKWAS
jgi:hypothetical protein